MSKSNFDRAVGARDVISEIVKDGPASAAALNSTAGDVAVAGDAAGGGVIGGDASESTDADCADENLLEMGADPGCGDNAEIDRRILDFLQDGPKRFADVRLGLFGAEPALADERRLLGAFVRLRASKVILTPRRFVYALAGSQTLSPSDLLEKARPEFVEHRTRILLMEGEVSQISVSQMLGITRQRAQQILSEMVESGDLRRSKMENGRVCYGCGVRGGSRGLRRHRSSIRAALIMTQPLYGWSEMPDFSALAASLRSSHVVAAWAAEFSEAFDELRSEGAFETMRLGYRERVRLGAHGRRIRSALEGRLGIDLDNQRAIDPLDDRIKAIKRPCLTIDQMLPQAEAAALMAIWMFGPCASPFVRAFLRESAPGADESGVARGLARLALGGFLERATPEAIATQREAFSSPLGRGPSSGGTAFVLTNKGLSVFPTPAAGDVALILALVQTVPSGVMDARARISVMVGNFRSVRQPVMRLRVLSGGQKALLDAMGNGSAITTTEASRIFGGLGLNPHSAHQTLVSLEKRSLVVRENAALGAKRRHAWRLAKCM